MWLIILINYGQLAGPIIKHPPFFFQFFYFCILILDLGGSWWILEEERNTREWHMPGNSETFKAEIKGAGGPQRWLWRAKAVLFIQFSSVTSDSLWYMDSSTPGLPIHHQLPELVQTHVHWVSDVIQPSHPPSSPSPPDFNLSQHQGLFQQVSSLH